MRRTSTEPRRQPVDLRTRSIEVILAGQAASGAFIASPTFEQYRFAWFRDGAFVAEALDLVGRSGASHRFHAWAAEVVLRSADGIGRAIEAARAGRVPAPEDYIHCRYGLDGSVGPEDWPTFQLDGPGIWLWSLAHHAARGGSISPPMREAAALVASYLAACSDLPSYDAWEESPDHVHTSTQAAILAGLRAAHRLDVAVDESVAEAERRLDERLTNPPGGLYTKWPGSPEVDASLLWIVAPYGLVGPEHPPFDRTLQRIEAELVSTAGGVYRYRNDTYYGGGEWPLLTAALGRVYLRRGRPGDRDRALAARRWIEAQADPAGHLPEQVATHALHPGHIDAWRARWGESACPLLWSHAAYLALVAELESSVEARGG